MTQADFASYTALTAKAVASNAKRLGLTWTMIPGTVQSYAIATGLAVVILDGDLTELTMVSLTGVLAANDRVMVMTVPPSSNYVIGPLGAGGGMVGFTSATTDSANVTAETVIATLTTNQELHPGRCYEVQMLGHFRANSGVPAVNTMGLLKIRNSTVGGTLLIDVHTDVVPVLGLFASAYFSGYFQVSVSGAVTLVQTLASNTATAVTNIANATGVLRWVKIVDAGNINNFSNILSI